MNKINAKTITDNKIMQDHVYYIGSEFNIKHLFKYMEEICSTLDIPVPIILNKHVRHLVQFNTVTFLPEDFVENLPSDKLTLEIF